ncbi:hypothetical protein [Ornithinibacillus halotolerans]|uniref:DUF3139 domain-containing protein n=1 Tax=Ornithinibacillus halotolerans TaxID=1274357 RepID=A0A916RLT5_9BACI|nr:hypothetical protein [Ornithinibacillus halotolerans]GGA60050.1 hypothetical protein GCM10008025_00110 [Ornithinibacillus halotolerans]
MKTKIVIALCFILLISAVLLFYPYNLYHHLTAEEKVTTIFNDPMLRENSFGDDSEITNVKYLGNYLYRVVTEESSFLVKIKSSNASHSIEVYEHNINTTIFEYHPE